MSARSGWWCRWTCAGRASAALSQETFALALGAGLEKLSVQMTVDQQAAIALFESVGFKAEALLRDHVRDVAGKTHDIVVLGHDVAQVRAKMEAYGLPGAVQRRPMIGAVDMGIRVT